MQTARVFGVKPATGRATRQVTRAAVEFYGPDRAKFLGPFTPEVPYLTESTEDQLERDSTHSTQERPSTHWDWLTTQTPLLSSR
ncbi:hypothetical protein M9435_005453 [Picochlorum sp. BPE23]|nr:hypothetical protein M9435_005453 [Picochlorum sp. BPE23]